MDLGTVDSTRAHLPCHECHQEIECRVSLTMVEMPAEQDGETLMRVGVRAVIDTDPLWTHFYVMHGPPDPFEEG